MTDGLPDSIPTLPALQLVSFYASEQPEWFQAAMAIRHAVFVDEQGVSAEHEADTLDEKALHWLVMDADTRQYLATGRMFANAEDETQLVIGRMAVLKSARGSGAGQTLLTAMLNRGALMGFQQALANAQVQALGFYCKAGFEPEGPEFMEENIPHQLVRKLLN